MYGSHIAYHFLVGTDGTIVQNRALSERTNHTRNSVVNRQAIAIVFAGNFQDADPPEAQLKAGRDLIERLEAIYHFDEIIPHRDASPTACPGQHLIELFSDLWREEKGWQVWDITRYYTPVRGQTKYFRSIGNAQFVHKALQWKIIEWRDGGEIWYKWTEPNIPIGHSLEEADRWFNDRPAMKEGLRKEMEYQEDFLVNCSGDCFNPADGETELENTPPFTVAACPPEWPFGTRIEVEGIGTVTCVDRGGAIKDKRLDVWAGVGMDALAAMNVYPGGYLRIRMVD